MSLDTIEGRAQAQLAAARQQKGEMEATRQQLIADRDAIINELGRVNATLSMLSGAIVSLEVALGIRPMLNETPAPTPALEAIAPETPATQPAAG